MGRNCVQRCREALMMSKAELARKAGLSTLTIDRVEAGRPCRLDTKRKILLALGKRISDKDEVFDAGAFTAPSRTRRPSQKTRRAHSATRRERKSVQLPFLRLGSKSILGLDIGSSCVKAVEVAPRGDGFELLHLGVAPLPPDAIVQGAFLNASAIADAIREAIAQVGLQGEERRGRRLGPLGDREEDHAPGDDRGGARGVDPLGGRAVHPVRRQRGEPRLPDPPGRRRGAPDGRAARRRQERSDRRLRQRDQRGGALSGRDRRRGLRGRERLRDQLRLRATRSWRW